MNDLEKYFENNTGNLINKWTHYFEAYDNHLARFRNTDVHILEIGVRHGGSLQMWKDYLGVDAKIYGVDVNPRSRELEEDQIEIFIGDQEDLGFLAELKQQLPRIDILIDDGGHTMTQQITTFEKMFHHVSNDGVYICEDTHTSYWPTFGGGFRQPDTFMEMAKTLIDDIHAFHKRGRNSEFQISDLTRSIESLHFYDSMVVIEKALVSSPELVFTGEAQF